MKKIWFNEKLVDWNKASTHVLTHGLHYGIGVFEGIRSYSTAHDGGTAVFRLVEHLKRLREGVETLGLTSPYSEKELKEAVKKVVCVNGLGDGYIRVIAFTNTRNIRVNALDKSLSVAVAAWPLKNYFGERRKESVSCGISSWKRLSKESMPAGTKVCGNYVNSFLAAREAEEKGFDEALLLDNNGFVCEASAENVFLVKASKLFTPPLSEGILAGVTRDSIMEIARARGIPVREKRLRLRDLREGSELFLTGTAAGVVPVNKLGEKTFDAPGEVTAKLQNVFSRVVRGEEKNFWKWLDFVA